MEGELCLLEVSEATYCVVLCMLEAVESGFCPLEALEVIRLCAILYIEGARGVRGTRGIYCALICVLEVRGG